MKSRWLLLLFLALISAAIAYIRWRPSTEDINSISNDRALWQERGGANYTLILDATFLPAPPVGLELTIRDGKITEQSILACDRPSEEYPERWCEPTKQYYSYLGYRTVEDLFDIAEECTRRTQNVLAKCPEHAELRADWAILFNIGRQCSDYLQDSDFLCAVEYDPQYGYPRLIISYVPGAVDGSGSYTIKRFELLNEGS